MNNGSARRQSKAHRRSATIALFKGIRHGSPMDVMRALKDGACPNAVSRGMTTVQRALKHFPSAWSPHIVGSLMTAAKSVPEMAPQSLFKLADGLATVGDAEALIQMLGVADESCREQICYIARLSFCQARHLSDETFTEMVTHVFGNAAEAVQRTKSNFISWVHVAAVGVDVASVGSRIATGARLWRQSIAADPRLLRHLIFLGADVHVRWLGMTPLHLAAFVGNEIALKDLLAAGANPDLPDGNDAVIGRGYGDITEKQLALIEGYRLERGLPYAASAGRARL